MNTKVKAEEPSTTFDTFKWLVALSLLVAAIAGNAIYADEVAPLYRVLALLVVAGAGIGILLMTEKGRAFNQLRKDAMVELRKVVWPTRQETTQTTMVVVVLVFIMALILWGLDTLFGWVISGFIG